jgi:hypothetical protein
MKFRASTDPALSEIELTNEQIDAALDLHDRSLPSKAYPYIACREIIALRAALEQHEQSVRAAKLARWRAGQLSMVGPALSGSTAKIVAAGNFPTDEELDAIQ